MFSMIFFAAFMVITAKHDNKLDIRHIPRKLNMAADNILSIGSAYETHSGPWYLAVTGNLVIP